jgi:hypothetical protein
VPHLNRWLMSRGLLLLLLPWILHLLAVRLAPFVGTETFPKAPLVILSALGDLM